LNYFESETFIGNGEASNEITLLLGNNGGIIAPGQNEKSSSDL